MVCEVWKGEEMTRVQLLAAIGESACTAPYNDGWDDDLNLSDQRFYKWVGKQVVEAIRREGFELVPIKNEAQPTKRDSYWRAYTKDPDSSGRPYHPVLVGTAPTKEEAQALASEYEDGYVIEVIRG